MKIKKLDSLRPGSREMEGGGRWEGQNFQQLKFSPWKKKNFTDCIYIKVTLARLSMDSLMMVCTDRNM